MPTLPLPLMSRWTAATVRALVGGIVAVVAVIFVGVMFLLALPLGSRRQKYVQDAAKLLLDLPKAIIDNKAAADPADLLTADDASQAARRELRDAGDTGQPGATLPTPAAKVVVDN